MNRNLVYGLLIALTALGLILGTIIIVNNQNVSLQHRRIEACDTIQQEVPRIACIQGVGG
jgi:hypothetical protein